MDDWVKADVTDEQQVLLGLEMCDHAMVAASTAVIDEGFGISDLKNAVEMTPELVRQVEQWLLLQPKQGFQYLLEEAIFMGATIPAQLLTCVFVPANIHSSVLVRAVKELLIKYVSASEGMVDPTSSIRLRTVLLGLSDIRVEQVSNDGGEGVGALKTSKGELLPLCALHPAVLLELLISLAGTSAVIASMTEAACDSFLRLDSYGSIREFVPALLVALEEVIFQSYKDEALHSQAIHILEMTYTKLKRHADEPLSVREQTSYRLWIDALMQPQDLTQLGRGMGLDSLSLEDYLDMQVRLQDFVASLNSLQQTCADRIDSSSQDTLNDTAEQLMERVLCLFEDPLHRTVRYVATLVKTVRRWSSKQFARYSMAILNRHTRLLGIETSLLLVPGKLGSRMVETEPSNNHRDQLAVLLVGMCVVAMRIYVLCPGELLTSSVTRFVQLSMNSVDDMLLCDTADEPTISSSRNVVWGKHVVVVLSSLLSQVHEYLPSGADRIFLTLLSAARILQQAGDGLSSHDFEQLITPPQYRATIAQELNK